MDTILLLRDFAGVLRGGWGALAYPTIFSRPGATRNIAVVSPKTIGDELCSPVPVQYFGEKAQKLDESESPMTEHYLWSSICSSSEGGAHGGTSRSSPLLVEPRISGAVAFKPPYARQQRRHRIA